MTVFVYPIPQRAPDNTLSGHFLSCKALVLGYHSGAKLVSEEAAQISPGGVKRSGYHATFTYTQIFAHQRQAVRSELFLFTHGQRFIKYRATYPVGQQAVAEPVIVPLLMSWHGHREPAMMRQTPNQALGRMTRSVGSRMFQCERHWRATRHRSALR